MKKLVVIFLIINALTAQSQNLKTPKEFYGFQPGTKVLFHHQVVSYFKYVAATRPDKVKLYQNGLTNEGREQIALVVGNPASIAKIEEIRANNLIDIGLKEGKSTGLKTPAIAYLSYSVHGNEIAGTTAVSDVLYELLNSENELAKRILKNTVVIIDPALNPDGYDRYSSWYNQVTNQVADATPYGREHSEPWPGGRFLHYLFDPNRDWAWQVQKESEQRTRFYNSWMPHLHADYHEMGANDPYYFPPAARPYHENMTPWQRDFHVSLGEYNKKYFDKNNWLYYTKEQYDLFYPSYGDSYPMYNGAIGMTYEQGGSGTAGLVYERSRDKDTLRLTDRAAHHFAASMATLELVSDKADKLVSEFVAFHKNANQNGVGAYKTFVVKAENNIEKVKALSKLLDKLQINYGFAKTPKQIKGFNFSSQTLESGTIEQNDLIISTLQPKGTMVKVLFEPKTALEDSNTYDITAWALPYAYGLKAFAVNEKLTIEVSNVMQLPTPLELIDKPYAYIIDWKDLNTVQFLAEMLKNKLKVRVSEQPFTIDGKEHAAGALILTRTSHEKMVNFDQLIRDAASKYNVTITSTKSGLVSKGYDFGSDYVYNLKLNPKIVVIAGEGVSPTAFGEVWHYFEQQIQYPATVVSTEKFSSIPLDKVDVMILPDGDYDKMLSDKNLELIKKWVKAGGKLIVMETALKNFENKDGFELKAAKSVDKDSSKTKKKYADRNRAEIPELIPGAIYKLAMDETHPLAFGTDGNYYALLRETYQLQNLTEGWNVGQTTPNSYITGFVGYKAKEKLKNTLIYGVEEMGRGTVIYMADDPLFRGFWHAGKMIFSNAVFMVK